MIKKLLGWLRGLWRTSKTKKAIGIIIPDFATVDWYCKTCKKYGLKPSPFVGKDPLQHSKYMLDIAYKLIRPYGLAITNVQRWTNKPMKYAMIRKKSNVAADIWIKPSSIGEM